MLFYDYGQGIYKEYPPSPFQEVLDRHPEAVMSPDRAFLIVEGCR